MNRVHKGVPTGGQFAATAHTEPGVCLGGGHEAPASDRHVPASLLMAHFQDPALARDLEWAVENSVGDADDEMDYRCDSFCDQLPNLHYEEAVRHFSRARNLLTNGGDWKAAVAEAAAADTARHPGGSMKEGYIPPVVSHQRGYGQGTLSTGSKYTGYRDATEICKDIRAELKAATAANYLPAGLTYSVTNEKFSGGQAITVRIQGVRDEDRIDRTELDPRGEYARRKEAKELEERVEAITNAYNRSDIDGQSDYFNVGYYGRVELETDRGRQFREDEAARRKAGRSSR